MSSRLTQVFHPLRTYWAERRGAAAAEFAIVLTILVFPLLNVIDFGMYIYQGMEVNEAAQAVEEAVLVACPYVSPQRLPVTLFCPDLSRAETTAVGTTSLGSGATLVAPPVAAKTSCAAMSSTIGCEGYYCVNGSGSLVVVGSFPNTLPADCTSVGGSATDTPGDYLEVEVSFTYAPMFTGVSLASQLPSTMTRIAWMRLS